MRSLHRLASLGLLAGLVLAACADGEHRLIRDGGSAGLDGAAAIDARLVEPDARVVEPDAATGSDAFTPTSPDASEPAGPDARAGIGRYLDPCSSDADCASGPCTPGVGGSSFCSRSCARDLDCAHGQLCAGGRCVPDDTGAPCSTASAGSCANGLCLGNSVTGVGHCTRSCAVGGDCPAGFACTRVGSERVCADVERPCGSASECPTGLCLGAIGCTSACESASDCPTRFAGFDPYTCELVSGQRVCVPPPDVVGGDAAGASCRVDADGLYLCRSGACDSSAPLGPSCTQACTARSGCGAGLGCTPIVDGSDILLVCSRAGSRALGASCDAGRECASGLCDVGHYCTRLCADGLCPSGWRCEPIAGYGVAICRR